MYVCIASCICITTHTPVVYSIQSLFRFFCLDDRGRRSIPRLCRSLQTRDCRPHPFDIELAIRHIPRPTSKQLMLECIEMTEKHNLFGQL